MNDKIPRTPFSTALSGSARETELRLRHIFSGPRKRPPAPFLALALSAALLCGNLVSCQVVKAEQEVSGLPRPAPSAAPTLLSVQDLKPDLNRNGIPEEVRLENEYGRDEVRFYENGVLLNREVLNEETPSTYLCTLDGTDYVLRWHMEKYQGAFHAYYCLYYLKGESETAAQSNSILFDTNFDAPFHWDFDPEVIAAFWDEVNDLMSHSVRLSAHNGVLTAEQAPPISLDWLDGPSFTRNPAKSLAENLRDLQIAETNSQPAPMGRTDTLPMDQPIQLMFCSGAGAWQSILTLYPDGTFVGDYCDSDGPIKYVCKFHGSFGDFIQLTGASWSLTLEELVLDTERPVGSEWGGRQNGEDVWYVSSQPAGFTDTEGSVLKPGAPFILYAPEARGDAPGTELYGAWDFPSWQPHGRKFQPDGTLGCWGLNSLETGYGFFDFSAWGIQ
ncbi:MAG: hypothetical protein HFF52_06700 [Lawsonibacter sp.]|nr:hypothetical protein [Lawsonibacter sp.]